MPAHNHLANSLIAIATAAAVIQKYKGWRFYCTTVYAKSMVQYSDWS